MKLPVLSRAQRGPDIPEMRRRLEEIAQAIPTARNDVEALKQRRAGMPFASSAEIDAINADIRKREDDLKALLEQQHLGDVCLRNALEDEYKRKGPAYQAAITKKAGELARLLGQVVQLSAELHEARSTLKEAGRHSSERFADPVTLAIKTIRDEHAKVSLGPRGSEQQREIAELNDFLKDMLHVGRDFQSTVVARLLAIAADQKISEREAA